MSDHDSFEDRLRAIADEVSRSVQRMSEVDMEELSERYGVDAERARTFMDAAGRWINDHLAPAEPLFGEHPQPDDRATGPAAPRAADAAPASDPAHARPPESGSGPHPLDLPTEPQGLALSALDSGRWTVRPGSNRLTGPGTVAAPAASDVVGELRGRDWITADGTLTLVGRHALTRWCRSADDPAPPA